VSVARSDGYTLRVTMSVARSDGYTLRVLR